MPAPNQVKYKWEQRIIHFKQTCFTFKSAEESQINSHRRRRTSRERGGESDPGELLYVIPFQFLLPNGCPASIYLNNRDHLQRPKAKIKYWVKARIVDFIDDETNLIAKCKKCLTITEEPPNFEFLMM